MELLQRATRGDLEGVKTLIQQGVYVNTTNRCSQTALYFACDKGHTDVVQYLLESGASVSLGAKPLIAAVRNNHYDCAKLLLEHHAIVHCTNTKRESPMSVAVQKYNYSIILLLLQYGAIPSVSLGDIAFELLMHAKAEHAKAIQKLIDQNFIDLTAVDVHVFLEAFNFAFKRGSVELAERMLSNESYSKIDDLYPDAVYYSAKNNWPTVLSKLFERNVNVNECIDENGQTPLYAACKEGHETVVTLLLNNGADPNAKNINRDRDWNYFLFPLQAAVQRGNAAICNMLLQKGAKLDQPGVPLLHIAVGEWKTETRPAEQMLSTIRLLLQQGVNVNAVSDEGRTALYLACTSQQLEVVQILLEAGADVNHTSKKHYPLIAACGTRNVEIINLLVSAGADVTCSNSSKETCLHVLINPSSSVTDSQKHSVCVSEIDAVISVMKSLLEAGADVNAISSQEETVLYRASKAGQYDIVRMLLNANAETKGLSGRRSLCAACSGGYTEIVDLLLQHGADSSASSISSRDELHNSSSLAICCAVKKGYANIVKLLLEHGAEVNEKDQSGRSALIHVVESLTAQGCKPHQVLNPPSEDMNLKILKYLLSAGGDVTVSSEYGRLSPLHLASSAGMCDLMMELIRNGANCNQLSSGGVSALDLACKNGHEAALEMLLKNGAKTDGQICSMHSVNSGNKSHSVPPLCMAAQNNSETMVKMLLKHGANVNALNEKGDTALHLATSTAVIEALLNARANVNATNNNRETALSTLCEKRQADVCVVELLLKFGADPNIGFPLHAACKNNDTDIVKLLLAHAANANLVKLSERLVFIPAFWDAMCIRGKEMEPSPLCTACKNGNVAIVDCLLKNGAHAAFTDSDGKTALHLAVERLRERLGQQANSEEYDPIVTLLLQRDAPVNVVSRRGETPLYLACMKGLVGVIKQLLDCRADVSLTTTNSNKYPLLIACERKFGDVAMMLLDRGADANVSKDDETPLKFATANGDSELVKRLLRCGADVNQMQDISDTALHVAVVHARKCVRNKAFLDIVQRLLKSSAGPNALNRKRETPLYLACRPTDGDINIDIARALLDHGADPNLDLNLLGGRSLSSSSYSYYDVDLSPLSAASKCGNTELVILLMKYGAVVDHRTALGRTALHYAIDFDSDSYMSRFKSSKTNTSTAEVLLSAGADANAMDKTGASPLYLACERGNTQLVKLLLSRGASPNVENTDKCPLYAACKGCQYDLVKLLLEYNADVAVRDKHGKTALHCALGSESRRNSDGDNRSVQDVVQLLLDRGADVNVPFIDGETPFYIACSNGLTSVVAKMLQCGAKVDGISGVKLPLNVACRNKHVSVIQLLLSNGANVDILEVEENRYRRALPLHIATADGSNELVELLLKHGSDVNVTDAYGSTALHYGIEHYRPDSHESTVTSNGKSVVDILLENRADVNIVNDSGETPLYIAVSRSLVDIVSKMLHTYGGNPNTPSPNKNVLVAACERRNVELVDMLLKNGADPNLSSGNYHPHSDCPLPLCTAVTQDNSDEIVMLLIKAGANVNAINREGKTALCLATENLTNRYRYRVHETERLSTVRLLLEHGADLNLLMPDGRSPLCLTVSAIAASQRREYHFIDLLQLMVKHGAILSDCFSDFGGQDISRQSHGTLKDLATFDGKHEFIGELFRAGAGFQLIALCCNAVAKFPLEARSISLCQAAVLAGYTPSATELQQLQPAAASEDADGGLLDQLANWLNEDRQRVPSLFRQCRVVIRRQLSTAVQHRSILTSINELPLPNSVKMYLQFEGTLTEVDLSVNKELCSEYSSPDNRRQLISPDNSDFDSDISYNSDYDFYDYDGHDSSDDDNWYYDSDNDEYL